MILALDSASSVGSVALVENGATVREIAVPTPRGRGGAIFTALEEILRDQPALERVVVGIGPGSYNGIRAAISVGWGIAVARRIPVVGLSSLLGLAEGEYLAIGDARRGQCYFAHVRAGIFQTEPMLLEAGDLRPTLEAHASLPIYTCGELAAVPEAEVRHASAALLARWAPGASPAVPEPLYLKPPHITPPAKKA